MSIHRFWVGPEADYSTWTACMIKSHMPQVQLVDWTYETMSDDYKRLMDDLLYRVDEIDHPRHMSNVARWWLMVHLGGLYLDHDMIVTERLPLNRPWIGALGTMRTSSMMNFPTPNNGIAREMLDAIVGNVTNSRRGTWVSGDHFIDSICPKLETIRLPYDAKGNSMGPGNYPVIHMWCTSSQRALKGELSVHPS